jgi:lipopolysaccharide export system permease protein
MTLQAHVMKIVATRVLGAALVLIGLLQILDLIDVTTDILARNLGVGGVIYYATLRLPRFVEQVAPISLLAGGLFAFSQLARENAVVVMRSAGLSAYRIVAMATPVVLAVMAVHFACAQFIAPQTDPMLESWWAATTPVTDRKAETLRNFRAGADLISAMSASDDGRELRQVTIYRRDAASRLDERIEAARADFSDKGWTLTSVKIVRFRGDVATNSAADSMLWPATLQPQDVQGLFGASPTPSAASARRALLNGGSDRSESYYRTRLMAAFGDPFASLIMLLIAAPVALANFRSGQGAVLLAGGLAAGLLYLVVDGMLGALGEGGAVSPILAVWGAPVIFGALAVNMLISLEG